MTLARSTAGGSPTPQGLALAVAALQLSRRREARLLAVGAIVVSFLGLLILTEAGLVVLAVAVTLAWFLALRRRCRAEEVVLVVWAWFAVFAAVTAFIAPAPGRSGRRATPAPGRSHADRARPGHIDGASPARPARRAGPTSPRSPRRWRASPCWQSGFASTSSTPAIPARPASSTHWTPTRHRRGGPAPLHRVTASDRRPSRRSRRQASRRRTTCKTGTPGSSGFSSPPRDPHASRSTPRRGPATAGGRLLPRRSSTGTRGTHLSPERLDLVAVPNQSCRRHQDPSRVPVTGASARETVPHE